MGFAHLLDAAHFPMVYPRQWRLLPYQAMMPLLAELLLLLLLQLQWLVFQPGLFRYHLYFQLLFLVGCASSARFSSIARSAGSSTFVCVCAFASALYIAHANTVQFQFYIAGYKLCVCPPHPIWIGILC